MKRYHTPKMSRTRVAAFKKKQKMLRIKKNPKCSASLEYQKTVINCTIPKVDNKEPNWDGAVGYRAIRDKIKSTFKNDKYKYKGERKPWYFLDTRKTYHYEERKTSWGTSTDFFRAPSEATMMYNKTIFQPKKLAAWYMEQVVQHKLAKWEKKHPRPVKEDETQPDLFEAQFVVPWEKEREDALERIRDFVVSVYDKLPLTGRFKKTENEYTESLVAELKDKNMDGHRVNELDPEKSKLLKKAQVVTNKVKAKRPSLVATNLKDHKRLKGRIILPQAA